MQSVTSRLPLIDHPDKASIEHLMDELESWPDMILMLHQFDKQCTYTSRQVKKVLGYDIAVWDNEFLSSVTHPDDIFSINEKMSGYLMDASKPFYDKEGPNIMKLFGRLRHVKGRYVPVEFSGIILRYDSRGAFELGVGVYQDISLRMGDDKSLKKISEEVTRKIEDHLIKIKRLYNQMYPHRQSGHSSMRNGGVSKIHIIGFEELAIKIKHGIEIQKILEKHTPGNHSLADIGEIDISALPFATRAVQCIEQRLSNPEFTTEEFARELNMSRGHLYRKIMQTFSVSPTELIKRMRLDKAAFLLRSDNESITRVAFSVGFTDSSYFSKCFRAIYGATPFAFRESERKSGACLLVKNTNKGVGK